MYSIRWDENSRHEIKLDSACGFSIKVVTMLSLAYPEYFDNHLILMRVLPRALIGFGCNHTGSVGKSIKRDLMRLLRRTGCYKNLSCGTGSVGKSSSTNWVFKLWWVKHRLVQPQELYLIALWVQWLLSIEVGLKNIRSSSRGVHLKDFTISAKRRHWGHFPQKLCTVYVIFWSNGTF